MIDLSHLIGREEVSMEQKKDLAAGDIIKVRSADPSLLGYTRRIFRVLHANETFVAVEIIWPVHDFFPLSSSGSCGKTYTWRRDEWLFYEASHEYEQAMAAHEACMARESDRLREHAEQPS